MRQGPLFAIHLFTAVGAALALFSMVAALHHDWNATFAWLGIGLIVDGIDGPLARKARLRERLPKWDGAALDFVIDYTTYVFIPAVIVAEALGLPGLVGAGMGALITVTGALYFADTRMKQPDNSFRGFPAVWNMLVIVLYALMPPPAVTIAAVILFAVMTFVPVSFVHPVRVVRWRPLTLLVMAVWFVAAAWLIVTDFQSSHTLRLLLIVTSLYLAGVAAAQQVLRSR
ncbi:CDP-alcohol phosphatidyltransferase family protein [Faunimonas pinastri]|uniref:CDP-alcohol phosphatidyltransferase family protein n=1 Tax=Faunimonas pinastri TaxID=1855383 RepID=UPI001EE9CF2D|nr:CDP-alcohol phosphatidyltransferase family protein [Faunimonas pinastri]